MIRWKLGSMVIGSILVVSPTYFWGIFGVITPWFITFGPNFLGHPSKGFRGVIKGWIISYLLANLKDFLLILSGVWDFKTLGLHRPLSKLFFWKRPWFWFRINNSRAQNHTGGGELSDLLPLKHGRAVFSNIDMFFGRLFPHQTLLPLVCFLKSSPQLMVHCWIGLLLWDSRGVPKQLFPFHFRGSNQDPNHQTPQNHQLTITWRFRILSNWLYVGL